MAVYNFMIMMVIIFMVQSYGNTQMVKQEFLCDSYSLNFDSDCYIRYRYYKMRCDPYHVILITNVTMGYYNETEEQTCCQRMPDNICTVEINEENHLGHYYRDASSCVLSRTCYIDTSPYHTTNRNDSCTSSEFLTYIEYMCVSNSSIINMTKSGVNQNFNSFSLSYDGWRYLRFDNHFYCSCEITADDADVSIYIGVLFLRLNVAGYNTSVTIYSRDQTVRYDANNTDMTHVDYKGYKHLFYNQLKQTKGRIHLVYEGDTPEPYNDKIWMDFKASEGHIKSNCRGCQAGYYIPPIFNPQTTESYSKASEGHIKSNCRGCQAGYSIPPIFDPQTTESYSKGKMDSTAAGQETSSSDIYKTALICVLGIIAVLGLVLVGVVIYKKRKYLKDKIETVKDVFTTSGPVSDVPTVSGTVSDIPTVLGTESNLPLGTGNGSEMYDTLEMNNQPSDVYDSLQPDTIYEMA